MEPANDDTGAVRIDDVLPHAFAAPHCGAAGLPQQFTASARDYLARHRWPEDGEALRRFVTAVAAARPGSVIDDAAVALLLHGERRVADRWLTTADEPLPMPNRRRPPPVVAAEEIADVSPLLDELERAAARAPIMAAGRGARGRPGLDWRLAPPRRRRDLADSGAAFA